MKTAVASENRSAVSAEKRREKLATFRASSARPRPSSRATSVPPPTPATFATAIVTLKIGRISEAPATIIGSFVRPMKKVSAML